MIKHFTLNLAIASLFASPFSVVVAKDLQETKIATFRNVVQELRSTLLAELTTALKAGDSVAAIEVCHTKVMPLTAKIAENNGIKVRRTSLKPRNPNNAPDAWEEQILKQFEERKAKGEDPQKLEIMSVVNQDGQEQIRYMKAMPTVELCLNCHGTNVAPPLQEKLNALYPEDKAIGFKVGDLRGAFSLTETSK